ncbi:hypothetical protein [Mesorhizobium sp. CA5]|uniref:hypothetical protein n=1 Tax=Mesorhizobium sp. CA5 TaxID=2876638 RepID=UPI001CD093C3|nr:hypothetical protein [Mesorhizobium sp. CA5]MBZ9843333.1 hypothetical protein [Mesorhizobium sp. CA5]
MFWFATFGALTSLLTCAYLTAPYFDAGNELLRQHDIKQGNRQGRQCQPGEPHPQSVVNSPTNTVSPRGSVFKLSEVVRTRGKKKSFQLFALAAGGSLSAEQDIGSRSAP